MVLDFFLKFIHNEMKKARVSQAENSGNSGDVAGCRSISSVNYPIPVCYVEFITF